MINSSTLERDKRNEFADAMLDIQKRIEKESAAETMIESKGFGNAFVRIDENTVDVVVSKQTLTDQEIAQIMDIVKRKTGVSADKIRISTLRQ
jgi:stage III sporulation protein AH